MLFPTMSFALFFVVVLGVSWRLNDKPRAWKLFMLAASYVFYGAWDWRFLGLIVASSVVNHTLAVVISGRQGEARRWLLILGVALNLGTLAYFKYYQFFTESLVRLLEPFGLDPHGLVRSVALPVAISFFTFQGLSYLIDVYRGDAETSSLIDVALYLAFFPQLVAGPIVRVTEFMPELRTRRNPDAVDVARAARLIGRGLVKKVVVASLMADVADPVFAAPSGYRSTVVFVAIVAYAVQIYADFSGYTDMAIGIALLLGFHFPDNFDRPYASTSIQDFWRRWHITLSRWLLDYLYIPLGGNRGGDRKHYRNLVLTMALGGLWHGAGGSFILWGLYQGVGLAGERWVVDRRAQGRPLAEWWTRARARALAARRANGLAADDQTGLYRTPTDDEALVGAGSMSNTAAGSGGRSRSGDGSSWRRPSRRRRTDEIPFDEEWSRLRAELEEEGPSRPDPRRIAARVAVFVFVCIGWVFFRSPTVGDAFGVLGRLFTGWTSGDAAISAVAVLVITAALAAQHLPTRLADTLEVGFSRWTPLAQALGFGVFLAVVDILGPQGVAPFIYFRF